MNVINFRLAIIVFDLGLDNLLKFYIDLALGIRILGS